MHIEKLHFKSAPGMALASLLAAIFLLGTLPGCQSYKDAPSSAQIETAGMKAMQQSDGAAERRLRDWAALSLPVAQRELGLLYQARPGKRDDAMQLFEQAARNGDPEAAFQLGEMQRTGVAGVAPAPDRAWPWYKMAALQKHARAALVLGMLFKNGDGVARDLAQAAKWLALSSELGNAHAMFLLSNAYSEGRGVPRDTARSRMLLEQAAEHEYPPAIQELAMTVQAGDALSPKDELRAGHLLKEATEHRHNNWNRF